MNKCTSLKFYEIVKFQQKTAKNAQILWQYSLLIQIKIKLVCFYYPYLQQPQIFKSRAATGLEIVIMTYARNQV